MEEEKIDPGGCPVPIDLWHARRVPLIFQERVNCWWTYFNNSDPDKDELFRFMSFDEVRGCLLNRRVDKSHTRDVGREEDIVPSLVLGEGGLTSLSLHDGSQWSGAN
ncbi:hypothetical protein AVEN_147194-1 [Araneus ventricosus]|uniref:Uncharacterized protein n=1 Tax=Araneus ventricosus TaxID=182803 RepID=A0A4Y2U2T9_ARAVE|nr:hypothetical protein AVEN_61950-1 [Araneus ventricosus]GBO06373.1 hypothetical protein AVEN_147194-1 [Araneus ventricosus]